MRSATATMDSRFLLGAELSVVAAGSLAAVLLERSMGVGWFNPLIVWVLIPYVAAASLGLFAYRKEWSRTFSVALLFATTTVAALSSWIYASVAFGRHESSTEGLVFLFIPLWGFLVGGVLLLAILGCVWIVRFIANRWTS